MLATLILGILGLGGVLWWLLDRHEKRRAAAGKARHSALRLFFAALGLLTILFAGGCSLLFLANMDGTYVTSEAILLLGGSPLAMGLLVWWLAMRRKSG